MVVIRNPLVVLPPPAGAVSASAACLAYTSGMGMPQLVSLVFGCVVTAIEFSTANTAALFAAVAAGSNAANIFGVGLAGTDHAGLTELVTAAIGRIGSVPRGAANGGHGLKRPLLQRYKQDSSSLRRRTSHLGHRTNSAYSAVVEALEEARDLELGRRRAGSCKVAIRELVLMSFLTLDRP